ncbi:hypothetical protein ONS95_007156 [Cadophora gregata]|uniref:uncharacterized protein n=1 Tax=Cadophora gregata TaxID=51156 RepID=UPI0026DA76EB|nr:uncharacterized protein ONS95_007156 [Cadophora gregata]KAK0100705.1 hypothetical protein ONS95_007156 [Cadophora gregata]KAK0117298.1 hypothetical protein ONS96_013131 [Cadophora gregata f. sp. sojae]
MSAPIKGSTDIVMANINGNAQLEVFDKFILYPELPKELRLQIIEIAIDGAEART